MEAIKRRSTLCDMEKQLRSSLRMQMRRTKCGALENVKDIRVIGISVEEIRSHGKEGIIYDRIKVPLFKKNSVLLLEKIH